jgi:hypothetical protein
MPSLPNPPLPCQLQSWCVHDRPSVLTSVGGHHQSVALDGLRALDVFHWALVVALGCETNMGAGW